VDAAILRVLARHTIRAAAVAQRRSSEVLTTLNEVLLRTALRTSPGSAALPTHDVLGAVLAFWRGAPRDDIAILAVAIPKP
jgi:hypothetical protein